jgi:aspartate kinase
MTTHVVVQKFGGTSVADPAAIRRLIAIARRARTEHGRGPVVVVSAMSQVTDALLSLAQTAGDGDVTTARARLAALRDRHRAAFTELVVDNGEWTRIASEFDVVEMLLPLLAEARAVSPQAVDTVGAAGELASSRIVAAALNAAGVPATWIDARHVIVTGDDHMRAVPLRAETRAALQAHLTPVLDEDRVPVMGGFVGATRDGVTTTLGRGGSDYSGAIVGAGIGAAEIQIWTDVDGMLTADPRVVPNAKVVPHLSFAEAAELAYFGAKVLHPATILPAIECGIPVRILNSHNADAPGTRITASPPPNHRALAGLAGKRGLTVIDITSSRMLMAYGFLRRVFEVFEHYRTAVDVVTTSEVSVSVTVDDRSHLDAIVVALSEFATVSVDSGMALLCAVGDRLPGEPAIAARAVGVLEEVPLEMISQAASRRNITVVLREVDLAKAMHRLHEEFFE